MCACVVLRAQSGHRVTLAQELFLDDRGAAIRARCARRTTRRARELVIAARWERTDACDRRRGAARRTNARATKARGTNASLMTARRERDASIDSSQGDSSQSDWSQRRDSNPQPPLYES